MIPSTGSRINADSTVVIPIKYIRKANAKLLEREGLIEMNKTKDSLIMDYKNYIDYQYTLINDLGEAYIIESENNIHLTKEYKKEKNLKNIFIGTTVISTAIAVIFGVLK